MYNKHTKADSGRQQNAAVLPLHTQLT